jgi:dihydrofolate reductase
MARVIYSMMVSLDGFVEDAKGGIDWILIDEELHSSINDQQSAVGAYLHGRRMYELMNRYWPTADADPSNPGYVIDFARIWKAMPKVVFSKTLDKVEDGARLVRGDVGHEIKKLKAASGKDLGIGGATLAATVVGLGLVDEYQLYVQPVVLGSGTPMFPRSAGRLDLRLVETRRFASGVVLLRLQAPADTP